MRRWFVAVLALCATSGAVTEASVIQLPTIGGRSSAVGGNEVALATDGPGMLLVNSAGIVGMPGTQIGAGSLVGFTTVRYQNPDSGYDAKSSETPLAPTLWMTTDHWRPWHVGFGLYGSVGAAFNFPGNPGIGIENRFLSELSVLQAGLVAGRELAPGLRAAVQLAPTYAKLRLRAPSPVGAISFDVDGFGIAGTAGLTYDLGPATTVGVSYRSPATVWLSGDGDVGPAADDVDLDLHLPQSVAFGFSHLLTERLRLLAQARWTDYPEFEESIVEWRRHPEVNRPLIPDARSAFRWGAGAEWQWRDELAVLAGFTTEPWMLEEASVSPLLSDYTDYLFAVGLRADLGRWAILGTLGTGLFEDRVVNSPAPTAAPGRYEWESSVVSFEVVYRL